MTHPDRHLTRREFLKYGSLVSAAMASPLVFGGCAVDPVTGEKQLMMVSRDQEISIDKLQSPHQFSADYGLVQERGINRYISRVGRDLLPFVHRPDMPYNFNCVNANYINAYAFPGGTIGISRGILLKLDNEAELAALIGHELGHVNARHSAEQMSKGQLTSILVSGLSMAASTQGAGLGELTQQIGMLGQGLLLSKYSRDNEREADNLGNTYMTSARYSTKAFVGLMEMLNSLHKEKPNSAQILFSTHPMSSERLDAAIQRRNGVLSDTLSFPLYRDRYKDNIASLRRKREGIELLQTGEKHMAKKEYDKAEQLFQKALVRMPSDYTAHVLMAKALMSRKRFRQAADHAGEAKILYPTEAQGHYISGFAWASQKKFDWAARDFTRCDKVLPGNPQITFFKGYCLDKNGDRDPAAQSYITYLKKTNYQQNKYSKYAYSRLKEWGYVD